MAGNLEAVTAVPAGMLARSSSEAAASPAATSDPGGKNVAQTGQGLPPDAPPPAALDIESVARRLNELMAERQRSLRFHVDEVSGRTVITVRDAATHQVLRQIPGDEVLVLARVLEDTGLLVDARI